jgi:hypothetical protein
MSKARDWLTSRPMFAHGGVEAALEPSGFLTVRVLFTAEPGDWLAFGQWLLDTFGEPS